MSDPPPSAGALAADPSASGNAAHFSPRTDDVFARIAGRYDLLCDVFSLMAHRLWKARMAQIIADTPARVVLDVASGTGDIPLRLLRRLAGAHGAPRLVVTDLCPQMLDLAKKKIGQRPGVEFALADAHDLTAIPAGSIDVFSISFGIKICDRLRVIAEAARVLRPGGVFLCLEAARIPLEWLHQAYLTYMDWCLPLIARLATRNDRSAYDYLLRGIHGFPRQAEFAREIEAAGFTEVAYENLTFGIVALHRAVKRDDRIGKLVDGWRSVHIGVEGDDFALRGLAVWHEAWRATGRQPVELPHPHHPQQSHRFDIYEIGEEADPVRFAAGELSPGVYGFYVPA